MTNWKRVIHCAAASIGAPLMLAGCNGGSGPSNAKSPAAAATSAIAPAAPATFDGCRLPQHVIDAEHLGFTGAAPMNSDSAANGGIKWRGCIWTTQDGDGYSVNVRTTNLTIPMIEANEGFTIAEHATVGGRQAVTYHKSTDADLRADCLINVEMTGGSMELQIDNPASNRASGNLDSCEIAKKLAGELVATLPPSA